MLADAYAAVEKVLRNSLEPVPFPVLWEVCGKQFTAKGLLQSGPVGYAVVDALLRSGAAALVNVPVPGLIEGSTAPSYRLKLR